MGMLSYIREEIRVVKERDPAIKSSMEVLLEKRESRSIRAHRSGKGCLLITEAE